MMTIYALSSPPGRGGVAVIRISGAAARSSLESMTTPPIPPPRRAVLRRFIHPESRAILDQGLALWFPAPASQTGEDMVEFHCHGGRAVIESMLAGLALLPDYRLAEPGEFNRRSFRNGRFDLVTVEALADLIAADTEAQRQQAINGLDVGGLSDLCATWRKDLISLSARLEAILDFPDDVAAAEILPHLDPEVEMIADSIAQQCAGSWRGERLREGIRVALLGPPNVGKSSLLNALARREAALVAAEPGTTRDVIEIALDLGGYPVIISDMAGIRDIATGVEAVGIERAHRQAEAADILLVIMAPDQISPSEAIRKSVAANPAYAAKSMVILNKSDLIEPDSCPLIVEKMIIPKSPEPPLAVSAQSGAGLNALETRLAAQIRLRYAGETGSVVMRARQREALTSCCDHLHRFSDPVHHGNDPVLAAEDLRLALRALGRLAGTVDVEEVLDVVFQEFCIGK